MINYNSYNLIGFNKKASSRALSLCIWFFLLFILCMRLNVGLLFYVRKWKIILISRSITIILYNKNLLN